jgi:hypothetical protein
MTYKILQERLYEGTFGVNCLAATSVEMFHRLCKTLNYDIFLQLQLYIFGFSNHISIRGGNDLLVLINQFHPLRHIFKDWKTIKRKINKLTSQFSFLEKKIIIQMNG